MTTLIISLPADAHAVAVKWALEQRGEAAHILAWSDFPQKVRASYSVEDDHPERVAIIDGTPLETRPEILWNHRMLPPAPPAEIHAADHQAVVASGELLRRGLVHAMQTTAFAVNSLESKSKADDKLAQLALARRLGFSIPRTLVSNDPDRIEAFLRTLPGGGVVKPLKFMRWRLDQADVALFTTPIRSIEAHDSVAVSACPMIYQERIEKACEYRVVVFGRHVSAFRLGSQDVAGAQEDWREIDHTALPARFDVLPANVIERIHAIMDNLGLAYGSFDLALTPEGRWVFFEVNESGQFLWLEELCPEVPLLDMFACFLISRDKSFEYGRSVQALSYLDWRADARPALQAERERHVPFSLDRRYQERSEEPGRNLVTS